MWRLVPYLDRRYAFAGGTVAGNFDMRYGFFPWIASAKAAQYIWITSFYVRGEAQGGQRQLELSGAQGTEREQGQGRCYLKILVAGSAAWAIPAVLFAPGLGEFDWNFALLVAGVLLDGFRKRGSMPSPIAQT